MPVTIRPANHPAEAFKGAAVNSTDALLQAACPKQWRRCERIVQTSLTDIDFNESPIKASENGFVWAAYEAYSHHHHLVLRPEDIWFSILTQLNFYINAHAEELRAFFVSHEGQKDLEVVSEFRDFGALAVRMTGMMAKHVNDPALREWVMPDFTTTTHHDRVIGAVLFMGAMQTYFRYKMSIICGLPSVTLLGEAADWRKILERLDMIDQLGEQPTQFAQMLRPILQRMVLSFENPTSDETKDFWNRIVHQHPLRSGSDYLTGWLTAFCFWNDKGEPKRFDPVWQKEWNVLFDGVNYPFVDVDKIPVGFASVPVSVDDHGHVYEATMVAGSVGIQARASDPATAMPSAQGGQGAPETPSAGELMHNTLQPVSAWFMLENEGKEKFEAREAEKNRLTEELGRIRAYVRSLPLEDRDYPDEYMEMRSKLNELEAF